MQLLVVALAAFIAVVQATWLLADYEFFRKPGSALTTYSINAIPGDSCLTTTRGEVNIITIRAMPGRKLSITDHDLNSEFFISRFSSAGGVEFRPSSYPDFFTTTDAFFAWKSCPTQVLDYVNENDMAVIWLTLKESDRNSEVIAVVQVRFQFVGKCDITAPLPNLTDRFAENLSVSENPARRPSIFHHLEARRLGGRNQRFNPYSVPSRCRRDSLRHDSLWSPSQSRIDSTINELGNLKISQQSDDDLNRHSE